MIHGNNKQDCLPVKLVLNGFREEPVQVRSCEYHVFELFVFDHIFGKQQSLLSIFIHGVCYAGNLLEDG